MMAAGGASSSGVVCWCGERSMRYAVPRSGGVFVPVGFSAGASVVRDCGSVPAWMLARGWHSAAGERGDLRLRACDRREWMHEEERVSRR